MTELILVRYPTIVRRENETIRKTQNVNVIVFLFFSVLPSEELFFEDGKPATFVLRSSLSLLLSISEKHNKSQFLYLARTYFHALGFGVRASNSDYIVIGHAGEKLPWVFK